MLQQLFCRIKIMLKGIYTALVTPFCKDNTYKVDYEAFERFIEFQINNGVHGLVPCGTTGESPTLTNQEHDEVIEKAIAISNKRVPILAGTGSNSTREAIERTQHAQKAGADAALIMTPYYNKPTQDGIFAHFKEIHDNSDIKIVIYNIPGRSVVDISDKTIAKMVQELPRIAGIKDATGDVSRVTSLKKLLPQEREFALISGEDATAVDFNRLGGVGCISVTSNIAPAACSKMQQLCLEGKFNEADEINKNLMIIHNAMFCETSPQPVKYACELMGLCSGNLRLPLVPASETNKQKVKAALKSLNLI